MKELTKFEEILLVTIWKLQENAYGVKIRQAISNQLHREYTYGNLYSALDQLSQKGLVQKRAGESTEKRRGRRKIFYTITASGIEALNNARKINEILWMGIPSLNVQKDQ